MDGDDNSQAAAGPQPHGDDRAAPAPAGSWDPQVCQALIERLWQLRAQMLATEQAFAGPLARVSEAHRASARNLTHYLALRAEDRRPLQEELAWLGLSSLGRAESHVLANLDKVLGILHRLTGQAWSERSSDEPAGIHSSRRLLAAHTAALLGAPPPGRAVRIMVTLPSEAAGDDALVRRLVEAGMDIARINCAHDDAEAWAAMATRVRQAASAAGRPVRILMDLAGPKLRTGLIASAPPVLKLQPERDAFGRVTRDASLGLRPFGSTTPVAGATAHIEVNAGWLAQLDAGERLDLIDARGARRSLRVVRRGEGGVLAEAKQTVYLVPETRLRTHRERDGKRTTRIGGLPSKLGQLVLRAGDHLRLTRPGSLGLVMQEASNDAAMMPVIACTLPEVFTQVRAGERILFDDGRIGGIIREVGAEALTVEIVQAGRDGSRLAGDKGIKLPDSSLGLPALTAKDIEDLATVARHADLVGLSFVHQGSDVDALRSQLDRLGAAHIGVVLKIETRRAFENLPELLLSAMASPAAGVMIARGDLAVECGYERLAEVQEEILWAAEAAHLPVIWATQVLETLARTGQPSRTEITDAAMGKRAECVMLGKGPHILDAMRVLDDILRRMETHQARERSLLRALGAWSQRP